MSKIIVVGSLPKLFLKFKQYNISDNLIEVSDTNSIVDLVSKLKGISPRDVIFIVNGSIVQNSKFSISDIFKRLTDAGINVILVPFDVQSKEISYQAPRVDLLEPPFTLNQVLFFLNNYGMQLNNIPQENSHIYTLNDSIANSINPSSIFLNEENVSREAPNNSQNKNIDNSALDLNNISKNQNIPNFQSIDNNPFSNSSNLGNSNTSDVNTGENRNISPFKISSDSPNQTNTSFSQTSKNNPFINNSRVESDKEAGFSNTQNGLISPWINSENKEGPTRTNQNQVKFPQVNDQNITFQSNNYQPQQNQSTNYQPPQFQNNNYQPPQSQFRSSPQRNDSRFGQTKRKGYVITITVPKGGVGKSSLTLNLAAFLGLKLRKLNKTVCVIDANFQQADSGKYLDKWTPNITEIARDPNILSRDRIDEIIQSFPKYNISVLLGPENPDDADPSWLRAHLYVKILDLLRERYDYIIIDTPVAEKYHELFKDFALPQADFIIVPVAPNLPTLWNADLWLKAAVVAPLSAGGANIDKNKIGILLNMAQEDIGCDEEEVRSVLHEWNFIGSIPYSKEWIKASNNNELIVSKNFSDLHLVLAEILNHATGEPALLDGYENIYEEEEKRGIFSRFRRRK